jgi:hypothetical protein
MDYHLASLYLFNMATRKTATVACIISTGWINLKGSQQVYIHLPTVVIYTLSHFFSIPLAVSQSYTLTKLCGITSKINELNPNLVSRHALGVTQTKNHIYYVQEPTLISTLYYTQFTYDSLGRQRH